MQNTTHSDTVQTARITRTLAAQVAADGVVEIGGHPADPNPEHWVAVKQEPMDEQLPPEARVLPAAEVSPAPTGGGAMEEDDVKELAPAAPPTPTGGGAMEEDEEEESEEDMEQADHWPFMLSLLTGEDGEVIDECKNTPLGRMIRNGTLRRFPDLDQTRFLRKLAQGCGDMRDLPIQFLRDLVRLYHECPRTRKDVDDMLLAMAEVTEEGPIDFDDMIRDLLSLWAKWCAELAELESCAGSYGEQMTAGSRASEVVEDTGMAHLLVLLGKINLQREALGKSTLPDLPKTRFFPKGKKSTGHMVEVWDPSDPSGEPRVLGKDAVLSPEECHSLLLTWCDAYGRVHIHEGQMLERILRFKMMYWFLCKGAGMSVPCRAGMENVAPVVHAAVVQNQSEAPGACGRFVSNLFRIIRSMGQWNDVVKSLLDQLTGNATEDSLSGTDLVRCMCAMLDLTVIPVDDDEEGEEEGEGDEDDTTTPGRTGGTKGGKKGPAIAAKALEEMWAYNKELYAAGHALHSWFRDNAPYNSKTPGYKAAHNGVLADAAKAIQSVGERSCEGLRVEEARQHLKAAMKRLDETAKGHQAQGVDKKRLKGGKQFRDAIKRILDSRASLLDANVTEADVEAALDAAHKVYVAHLDAMTALQKAIQTTGKRFKTILHNMGVYAKRLRKVVNDTERAISGRDLEEQGAAASEVVTDAGGQLMEEEEEEPAAEQSDKPAAPVTPCAIATQEGIADTIPPVVPRPMD